MISELVKEEYERTSPSLWAGHVMLPCNVCSHCGYEDDPDGPWRFDNDDDRVCLKCAEQEGIEADDPWPA